jgi:TatD DNase family protein
MILCDTHAHLDFPEFDSDREAVIRRAVQSGIVFIINIGINLDTSLKSLEMARTHPEVFAAVGFHPHDAIEATPEALLQLESLARDPKVVAIGEVGLDYYRDRAPHLKQQEAFRNQIRLAKHLDLPLIIHTRNAHQDTLKLLHEEGVPAPGGVFHCFSGEVDFAREVLRGGFHISFTGNITYKNSRLPEIAHSIPLEKTLLETDCPFLAPEPLRGKRSEPMMVRSVANALSRVHGVPIEQVGEICTQSAKKLFNVGAFD